MKLNFFEILGRVFLCLLIAALMFLALDKISLRILRHRRSIVEQSFAARDIRRPRPYIMFKGAPYGKAWKKSSPKTGIQDNVLNELGYPGDVPVMPKPAGEYRVIVLGGSTAFMGNPPIPRLIQYQFEKKQCPAVKVYNFSVVSSVTSMELARLVYEAVNYSPDLIISYSGFNDIDEPFVADPRPGYPFNYFVYESNPILDSEVRDYPLIPLIAYGSNLLRVFFPGYFLNHFADLDSLRRQAGYQTPEWRQAIADNYIENMRKSYQISRAFGAEFLAFFQPALYFKEQVTAEEQPHIEAERRDSARELRQLILDKARDTRMTDQGYFINLSDFFAGYPGTVFVDRVHLDYQYRPDVAVEIYQHILKFLPTDRNADFLSPVCRGQSGP